MAKSTDQHVMDVESLFHLARAAVICPKLNVLHSDHHCAHVAWCQRGAVTHCLYSLRNIHPASKGSVTASKLLCVGCHSAAVALLKNFEMSFRSSNFGLAQCVCYFLGAYHVADPESACSATKHEWTHGVLPQPVWGPNEWHGRQHEASVWRPQRHAGGYDAGHGPTPHDAQQLQLWQLWKQQLWQLRHATHDAAAAAPHVWRACAGGYGP